MLDIALWAVPLGIIGARIYHVLTHPDDYFFAGANVWNPCSTVHLDIWEGGNAIFGALIGGAIGACIGCRFTGIRFWSFADALAPGLLRRAGHRPSRQLVQPRALRLADRPAVGPRDRVRQPGVPGRARRGHAVPPDVPLRDRLEPRSASPSSSLLERQHQPALGQGLRASTSSGTALGRSFFESIRVDPSEMFLGIRVERLGRLRRGRARHRDLSSCSVAGTPATSRAPTCPGVNGSAPDAEVDSDDIESDSDSLDDGVEGENDQRA